MSEILDRATYVHKVTYWVGDEDVEGGPIQNPDARPLLRHDAALRAALATETDARKAAEDRVEVWSIRAEAHRQSADGASLRIAELNAALATTQETNGTLALRIATLEDALVTAERERDEALRTVAALTPAANYCLQYKPLLLAAESALAIERAINADLCDQAGRLQERLDQFAAYGAENVGQMLDRIARAERERDEAILREAEAALGEGDSHV